MKVFLMGNGFDLRHGLKTKFTDFRDYLKDNYRDLFEHLNSFLKNDKKWSNIETELRTEGIDYFIQEIDNIIESNSYQAQEDFDISEPSTYSDEFYANDNEISSLIWLPRSLNEILLKWITKINNSIIKKDKKILLNKYDVIVSFNYTDYWKKIYKYSNRIYFAHGEISKKNVKIGYTLEPNKNKNFIFNNFDPNEISTKNYLSDFNKANWEFIKKIKNIKSNENIEIYSFGFSFGEEDLIYLSELNKQNSIKIFLNKYDDIENKKIIKILEKKFPKIEIKQMIFFDQ